MCDCENDQYCIKCFDETKAKPIKCSCTNDLYAFYKIDNKLYCSECYIKNGGKNIYSLNNRYITNSPDEIFDILKIVKNYSSLQSKLFMKRLHVCKNYKDLIEIIKDFDKSSYFLTSNDASKVLQIIFNNFPNDKKHIYENVICCKVLDYWNMTQKKHGVGACYFNSYGIPKTINQSIIVLEKNVNVFKNNFSKDRCSLFKIL